MNKPIDEQLISLCDIVPAQLRVLSEKQFTVKPTPDKWSKKELLGHLIDSAANNHQRFVRAQLEDNPVIYYDQDGWVDVQKYQLENTDHLITIWEMYNRHLAHIIKHTPIQCLYNTSIGRDGKSFTLEFLVNDYLEHLEHHLAQLLAV